jgi:hypothetical protein
MVYSNDTSETVEGNNMAERAAQGVKLLGAGVVKVVHRCNDAKGTNILNLSSCSLTQVPDAIYFLMRASDGKLLNMIFSAIISNIVCYRTDHRESFSFSPEE